MREIKAVELKNVSGGAFYFFGSASKFYEFLRSDKNPLNGAVIGLAISKAAANMVYPMLTSVINVFSSLLRK
jgi:hypothetical protein